MTKKINRSFCFCYLCLFVCVSVCLSVSALQVTVFVVGSWFLAWGMLKWNPKDAIFCFSKFWDLTQLWLFLDFLGVFCYPLLILKESVDRTKWHRDLTFGIWDLYIVINWSLKYLINILKITSGFVAKTKKMKYLSMVIIICDFTKYRHFLNRNLS